MISNLSNDRLSITATADQITAVKTAIQTIATNFPFLIGLTADERRVLPAIEKNNKAFVEDAINAGVNNTGLIPSYVSVPKMQTDFTLFNQLDEIHMLIKQLEEKIDDTKRLAGSEAYVSALAVYKLFSAAADAGVPGSDSLYTQLRARFAGQGGKGTPATDPSK